MKYSFAIHAIVLCGAISLSAGECPQMTVQWRSVEYVNGCDLSDGSSATLTGLKWKHYQYTFINSAVSSATASGNQILGMSAYAFGNFTYAESHYYTRIKNPGAPYTLTVTFSGDATLGNVPGEWAPYYTAGASWSVLFDAEMPVPPYGIFYGQGISGPISQYPVNSSWSWTVPHSCEPIVINIAAEASWFGEINLNSITLSGLDPTTLPVLPANAEADARLILQGQGFPSAWNTSLEPEVAKRYIDTDLTSLTLKKGNYRIQFTGEAGARYVLHWTERTIYEDGTVTDVPRSSIVMGNGEQQTTEQFFVEPPTANARVVIKVSKPECCQCTAGASQAPAENNALNYTIPLGKQLDGTSAGTISLNLQTPQPGMVNGSLLNTMLAPDVFDDNGTIFTSSLEIDKYADGDDYVVDMMRHNGDPVATWRFSSPNANTLNISQQKGGLTTTDTYIWDATRNGWEIRQANQSTITFFTRTTGGGGETIEKREVKEADATLIGEETRTYIDDPNAGHLLVSVQSGPSQYSLITTYQYYINPADNGFGQLKQIIEPSGKWTRYFYTTGGRKSYEVTGKDNSTPSDTDGIVTAYDYTPNTGDTATYDTTTPRRVIVKKVAGGTEAEISRAYTILATGYQESIRCTKPGGAISDVSNLKYKTWTFTGQNEWISGRVRKTEGPDGLRTVHSFAFPNESTVEETVLSGKPAGNPDGIAKGTRTVTVMKLNETIISKKTYDIETSAMLDSVAYSNFDADDRAQRVDYLNGTYATMAYSCCGLESVTKSDGTAVHYTYDDKKRVQTETRDFGSNKSVTLVYSYDAADNITQVTRSWNGENPVVVKSASYDLSGRVESVGDILGIPTEYGYTTVNGRQQVTITHPDQSTSVTLYKKDGSIDKVTGNAVAPAAFESDVETVDGYPRAFTKRLAIDESDYPTGLWTKSYTDSVLRPFKVVDSAGLTTTPHYNSLGQMTGVTGPNNVTTLVTYDDRGRPEYGSFDTTGDGQLHLDGDDPVTRTASSVSVDDALAGETVLLTQKYVWPEQGEVTSRLSGEVRVSLDGLRIWTTIYHDGNPLTTRTTTVIDDANDTTTVTAQSPIPGAYSVQVFKYGNLIEEKACDANAVISRKVYGYDGRNRLGTITDERNGDTAYGYDNYDRLHTLTTPAPGPGQNPLVTTYEYDQFGRQWKTILPDGTFTTKEFNESGRVAMVSGSQTYRTGYGYDLWGRMTTMTNWTAYPNGKQVSRWVHDDTTGRLVNRYYPDKNSGAPSTMGYTYGYNSHGQLETITSARGIVTTKFYDDWGRNWKNTFAGGAVATPDIVTTFNRLNLPEQVVFGSQSTDYLYDWLGGTTTETYTGGPLDGAEVNRTFNEYHQPELTTAVMYKPGVEVARAEYLFSMPPIGRGGSPDPYMHTRIQAIRNGTRQAIIAYEDNSPLVKSLSFFTGDLAFPGARTMTYDKLNRLTSISSGGETHVYEHNLLGKVKKETLAGGSYWDYSYDALGQLESAVRKLSGDTPSINENHTFVSDQIGNLTAITSASEAAGATRSFTPNAINQITAKPNLDYVTLIGKANPLATLDVPGHTFTEQRQNELFNLDVNVPATASPQYVDLTVEATIPAVPPLPAVTDVNTVSKYIPANSSETLAYDDDGNLISDGRWTYVWDAMNRLVQMVSLPNVPASQQIQLDYTYDAMGRRIALEGSYTPLAGSQDIRNLPHQTFIYDGWKLIAEKGWGFKARNNSYTWLGDELIMLTMSGAQYSVSTDGRGNVTKLYDQASPYATAVYEYEPYGKLIRATAENAIGDKVLKNPFRFSSEYYDDITGLIYYGYRYYSPDNKRWLSRDPIDLEGGMNVYGFVANDPVNVRDLLGLVGTGCFHEEFPNVPGQPSLGEGVKAIVGVPSFLDSTGKEVQKWAENNRDRINHIEDTSTYSGMDDFMAARTAGFGMKSGLFFVYVGGGFLRSPQGVLDTGKAQGTISGTQGLSAWDKSKGYTLSTLGDGLNLWATGGLLKGSVNAVIRAQCEVVMSAANAAPRVVNADTIRAALEGATLKTTQEAGVSIPAVERYVRMLEAGSPAPAIQVADGVIVNGNHRYVAGRIFGVEPPQVPGTLAPSQVPQIKPIQQIKLDPTDWGNH